MEQTVSNKKSLITTTKSSKCKRNEIFYDKQQTRIFTVINQYIAISGDHSYKLVHSTIDYFKPLTYLSRSSLSSLKYSMSA